MSYVSIEGLRVPVVTTEQMREVDRLMVEKYGIQLIQMMENAGWNLAELARRLLGNSVAKKQLFVAVGKGNNGGGGMVAARHLYNWGAEVTVLLPNEVHSGVPETQRTILQKLPVEMKKGETTFQHLSRGGADMVIDTLIGYGLSGNPRGWTSEMIEAINALDLPVLALDVPSGLDATSGEIYSPCVKATATMTLALPKTGLVRPEAREVVGSLYLADIGVPDVLYEEMGIAVGSVFLHDTIVKADDIQGHVMSA